MKKMKLFAVLGILALVFSACDTGGGNDDSSTVSVTGVALDKDTLIFNVDSESETLVATVSPANASNKAVTWESSDTDVATVVGGVVTPVDEGTATITVKTNDGNFIDVCAVTVKPAGSVTGISLDQDTLIFTVGDAPIQLIVTVEPDDAINQDVIWESSDDDVATVVDGEVTPIGPGTATITVTSDEDDTIFAVCEVTVNADDSPVPVTGVGLDEPTLTFTVGDPSQTLTATVMPLDATNKAVTWVSNDTGVATVTGGVVTPVGAGVATITVKTDDGGFIDTCTVTVSSGGIAVTGVTLDKNHLVFKTEIDAPKVLNATVTPPGATNPAVIWESSDDDVVEVSTGGTVTPIGLGRATITATTVDGSFTAECNVAVSYIDLVWIEAGTFMMGSPPGEANRRANEAQFEVTLSEGYYMAQYPVQVKEFRGVGLVPNSYSYTDSSYDNRPIGQSTWYDGLNFCNYLSIKEGLEPVYTITGPSLDVDGNINAATITWDFSKNGYRLPTEAQWEYACRADTETAWWWGDVFDAMKARTGAISDVGYGGPNPWDLYDMSGNVGEWVWDKMGSYPGTATNDWVNHPNGTEGGGDLSAITRGGPYDEPSWTTRSACRNDSYKTTGYERNTRFASISFRVVRPE